MGMKRHKKLVAVTGKYKGQDGQEKNQYVNCGTLFQRDDGSLTIKLDSLPLGEFNGWINCYDLDEDRAENNAKGMQQVAQDTGIAPSNGGGSFDDQDIPFAPYGKNEFA